MGLPPFEWHDYFRALAFFVSIYCVIVLIARFRSGRHKWNTKTLDYWYALLMWSLGGAVLAAQGIVLDYGTTAGFVFLTAASLVTGKGLSEKGRWGEA